VETLVLDNRASRVRVPSIWPSTPAFTEHKEQRVMIEVEALASVTRFAVVIRDDQANGGAVAIGRQTAAVSRLPLEAKRIHRRLRVSIPPEASLDGLVGRAM